MPFAGSGALNFVEFMAAMMANLPEVYCSHSSLKAMGCHGVGRVPLVGRSCSCYQAVFHFFDSGHGILQGEQLHLLFPARRRAEEKRAAEGERKGEGERERETAIQAEVERGAARWLLRAHGRPRRDRRGAEERKEESGGGILRAQPREAGGRKRSAL